jgi:hypothetical protein
MPHNRMPRQEIEAREGAACCLWQRPILPYAVVSLAASLTSTGTEGPIVDER